jgi:large subunit ribosomal protein L15
MQVIRLADYSDSFSVEMSPINLNRIQEWINAGRLDPTKPITLLELNSSRCIHGVKDGVKLLARGKEELTTPINIIVSRASAEAIEAVEKLGGTVTTRFYTPFAIRKIRAGEMDPIHSLQSRIQMAPAEAEGAQAAAEAMLVERSKYPFRLPDPTSRKDLEYYRDAAHRGYLSHMVEEGHGPSLFFKTPGAGRVDKRKVAGKGGKGGAKAENRVW